jgi:hypothetical protein
MFSARGGFQYYNPPAGGFGNNLYFPNNASQLLSKTSTTNLVTWKNTSGFTVEYWLYLTGYPGTINPGPGNHDGGSTNYWSFGPGANGMVEFYYWGSGQQWFNTANSAVALNTWNNISAVFTTSGASATGSIYINGNRQQIQLNKAGGFANTQTVTNGVVATGTVFSMGKYGASNRWNGWIDNLRVSNVNRYSGANYTVATSPFTFDSQTQLLIEPTGSVGSNVIAYQSVSGNANMTNASNVVTIVNTHANHT